MQIWELFTTASLWLHEGGRIQIIAGIGISLVRSLYNGDTPRDAIVGACAAWATCFLVAQWLVVGDGNMDPLDPLLISGSGFFGGDAIAIGNRLVLSVRRNPTQALQMLLRLRLPPGESSGNRRSRNGRGGKDDG